MLLCGTQQTDVNSIEPPWYSWRVRSCPRVTRWVLRWVSVVDNHGARRYRLRQVEVHCPVATGTPAHRRRHKGGCPRARPTPSAKAAPCDRGRSWSAPRAGSQTLASRSISSPVASLSSPGRHAVATMNRKHALVTGQASVPSMTSRVAALCNSDTANNIAIVWAHNLCPVTSDYVICGGGAEGMATTSAGASSTISTDTAPTCTTEPARTVRACGTRCIGGATTVAPR